MTAVEPERIHEKEVAILDGVNISGHWNRMFDERVIWDYDTSRLDEVTQIEGAESLGACYQCGKCTPVCPVDHVGDYSPRKIFRKTQLGISLLTSADLWLCTTCMNCLRVCPKEVNMIKIMPAVREQAVLQGTAPTELAQAFENTFRYGNPLGEPARKRADWAKDAGVPVPILAQIRRPVDILWFVECYPAYHPRGKDVFFFKQKTAYEIIAGDWSSDVCSSDLCDSQRLAGEKGLFEMHTEHNIKMFSKYQFNTLVTADPHALNAFKKEYPKYGGNYPVLHYTQFLAPMLDRIPFKKSLPYRVTFHDPCYLGRHNGEYEAPRRLLEAIPGITLTEMARCKANGYCCGGGGGGMWLDSFSRGHMSERLSERRVREAVSTGADVLAVCCPYEISRFEDAVKSTGNEGKLIVRDIIELIDESMRG